MEFKSKKPIISKKKMDKAYLDKQTHFYSKDSLI